MGSSKKKRGKQRKAAQCQAKDTKNLFVIYDEDGRTLIEKSQHDKCAKLVQRGDENATIAIKGLMPLFVEATHDETLVEYVHDIQREFNAPLSSPSDDGTYTFVNIVECQL